MNDLIKIDTWFGEEFSNEIFVHSEFNNLKIWTFIIIVYIGVMLEWNFCEIPLIYSPKFQWSFSVYWNFSGISVKS